MSTNKENDYWQYAKTFSLKTKDGVYSWLFQDGTERFPGKTFSSEKDANEFFTKKFGMDYNKLPRWHVKKLL